MVATNSQNSFWDVVKSGAQKAVSDLNEELGYSGKDKISLTFTAPKNENVGDSKMKKYKVKRFGIKLNMQKAMNLTSKNKAI